MLEKLCNAFVQRVLEEKLTVEGIAFADEKKLLKQFRFTQDIPRNIYSHTKSYTSTAAGIAISEGKLTLEDTLTGFFPEAVPTDAAESLHEIRLKHLLTMSSGFDKPYLMGADRRAGTGAPDYLAYMLSRPMNAAPGERFLYSTADSYLAGRMVEKAVGRSLSAYLYEKIFSPLGQGFPLWENCPLGHPIGGGGMSMTLTNMMKLGQLYLADGVWEGVQLVDPAWIAEATKKQIATPNEGVDFKSCGYGYQFWMSPYPGSYQARGAHGQNTYVFPQKGLVIAVQCTENGNFDRVQQLLDEEIFSQI